jgi:hypothetical protein
MSELSIKSANRIPANDLRLTEQVNLDENNTFPNRRRSRLGRLAGVAATGLAVLASAQGAEAKNFEPVQSKSTGLFTLATTPLESLPANASQEVLDVFGAKQVHDIPGLNMDFKEHTASVTPLDNGAYEVDYIPTSTARHGTANIDSIQVNPATHEANVTFSPSSETVTLTKPDTSDPTYPGALNTLLLDGIRFPERPFSGDEYPNDLFYELPIIPSHINPEAKLKLNRNTRTINFAIDAGNTTAYGDEMGIWSEEITVDELVRSKKLKRHNAQGDRYLNPRPAKWRVKERNIGRGALIIEGLGPILIYGGGFGDHPRYGLSFDQGREYGQITGVKDICVPKRHNTKGKKRKSKSNNEELAERVTETYRLVPNDAETFAHGFNGSSPRMKRARGVYRQIVRVRNKCDQRQPVAR